MRSIEDEVRALLGVDNPDPHGVILGDVAAVLHERLREIRTDPYPEEEAPVVVLLVATNKRWSHHVSEEPLTPLWQERAIAACMGFVHNAFRRKWGGRAA
jgi:hypothetical protein